MDVFRIFVGFFQIFKFDFEKFVIIYNSITPDYIWIFFLLFCFFSILIFLKLFGEVGLYVYSVIAIIAANSMYAGTICNTTRIFSCMIKYCTNDENTTIK